LSLEERRDPQHSLCLFSIKPLHHLGEIRQPLFINIEVVVAPGFAGSPRTIDPVDAVGNSKRLHHQDVFHDFGIEWSSDWRAIVVSGALGVFVAPAPWSKHPLRRHKRWASIDRVSS